MPTQQSPHGYSGVSIESVLNDKVITIGDHTNVLPCLHEEPSGTEIDNYSIADSGGMVNVKSAIPKYTQIDNGGDFHGGTFTINALNSFNLSAANGGISINTGGNINIASWGATINLLGTAEIGVSGQLVKINCTNTTMFNGPTLYINTDETIFNKNVIFGNNAMVNGGMVVNGELIVRHITAMRSLNMTTATEASFGYPLANALLVSQFNYEGHINIDGIGEGACIINGLAQQILTPVSDQPIVTIPGHYHMFDGPAISYVDGPTELFAEMKKAESNFPVPAKPNLPMDMTPKDLGNKLMNRAKDAVTKMIKAILPF